MVYGSRNFNAAFHKGSPIIPVLNRINVIPHIFYHIHFNCQILKEKWRKQKCLDWIITRISCVRTTFYFLVNRKLICFKSYIEFSFFNKEPLYLICFTFFIQTTRYRDMLNWHPAPMTTYFHVHVLLCVLLLQNGILNNIFYEN